MAMPALLLLLAFFVIPVAALLSRSVTTGPQGTSLPVTVEDVTFLGNNSAVATGRRRAWRQVACDWQPQDAPVFTRE